MEKMRFTSNYDLQVDIGKQIFLNYDQEMLIRKFHLHADGNWIFMKYLNILHRISRKTGSIEYMQQIGQWKECRSYDRVMTIYDLLCYSKGERIPDWYGQWQPLGSFAVGNSPSTGTFTKTYGRLFQGSVERLKKTCEDIGGIIQKALARADVTCEIPVTTFFSVLLQFWDGDEEFEPQLIFLWDKNSKEFLHFETMYYLQGDILEQIKAKFME